MTGPTPLLTVEEMQAADAGAIAGGVSGIVLMENAGTAVAEAMRERWSPRRVLVLAGPGNNGGDGFVAARRLHEAGWPVRVALAGAPERLRGDAAEAAARWPGAVEEPGLDLVDEAHIVVDALFGAGLARDFEGDLPALLAWAADAGKPVVAVDVPSGLDGTTGDVRGRVVPADLTVTFAHPKPGHWLLPGRELVGELVVADIGIPDEVVAGVGCRTYLNGSAAWRDILPRRGPGDHKYRFGHAVVVGGSEMTGAARMAAEAALRVGAGLVTLAAPRETMPVYQAAASAAVIVRTLDGVDGLARLLADDPRLGAVLLGPGGGRGEEMRANVLGALGAGRAVVLDADAITSFVDDRALLMAALAGRKAVLTPHEGEFARLFDVGGSKLERARTAARESGAVVVFKGADTIVVAPDGRALVNANAPPTLATAGTGDVLAGMLLGLMAQGLPAFEAAGAAVWFHGEAARRVGPGLVATDLAGMLPRCMGDMVADGVLAGRGPAL